MKALTGGTRTCFLGFFGSHIVFTLIVDGQALLGDKYPAFLRQLLDFYITTFQDPLMGNASNLLWFQSMIALEFMFQLPFFFVACYMIASSHQHYPDWFRCACLMYAAHTCTTLVPILAIVSTASELDLTARLMLVLVYLPYFIFPAWIGILGFTKGGGGNDGTGYKNKHQ